MWIALMRRTTPSSYVPIELRGPAGAEEPAEQEAGNCWRVSLTGAS